MDYLLSYLPTSFSDNYWLWGALIVLGIFWTVKEFLD